MSRKAWLWEFRNKSNVNRACELKCRADFLLVPAGCISLSPFPRQRSWRCKAANLWQPGSAVGKTMVASSLTGRRSQGRKGRKGADRRSKLVGGNWQTHSQRERTSTFLVIKVLPVYLSFRNASIEIFQNQGRRNGERSQGKRLMLRTANSSTSDTPICARTPAKLLSLCNQKNIDRSSVRAIRYWSILRNISERRGFIVVLINQL